MEPSSILKQELLESSENQQTNTITTSIKLKDENDYLIEDFSGAIKGNF